MIKIKTPINRMNCEINADKPKVNVPAEAEMPTPILLLKSKRKRVDATLNVKVAIVKLV